MKKIFKQKNKQKGFTIIETMISISIFLVIVMAGMGALLNANLLHNKSQNMRSMMDNLSFIVEDMSKNLRTGYNYHCITAGDNFSDLTTAKSCPTGGGALGGGVAFTSSNGATFVYYISSTGKIYKSTQGPYNSPPTGYVQLNADEINIDSLSSFTVLGAEQPSSGDLQQPFVIIRLIGSITSQGVVSPFSIQTSVSQRLIDL